MTHEKNGEKGSIAMRILFQPESELLKSILQDSSLTRSVIARSRQRTSTFSTAGRAITTIGGAPLAAGKGVLHGGGAVASGVGHGIGTVGGFAGRHIGLIKKKDKSGKEVLVEADGPMEPPPPIDPEDGYELPVGQTTQLAGLNGSPDVPAGAMMTSVTPRQGSDTSEPGTLTVTVLGARDLRGKEGGVARPYVQLKMSGKVHKTGHVKGADPEWSAILRYDAASTA